MNSNVFLYDFTITDTATLINPLEKLELKPIAEKELQAWVMHKASLYKQINIIYTDWIPDKTANSHVRSNLFGVLNTILE